MIADIRQLIPSNNVRKPGRAKSSIIRRSGMWLTPDGIVLASSWAMPAENAQSKNPRMTTKTSSDTVAARLVIMPHNIGETPFHVVFDFIPRLNLSARVTYQAVLPTNAKVFRIASAGRPEQLLGLLRKGTASLNDRDEYGRSLLGVSCCSLSISTADLENSTQWMDQMLRCAGIWWTMELMWTRLNSVRAGIWCKSNKKCSVGHWPNLRLNSFLALSRCHYLVTRVHGEISDNV